MRPEQRNALLAAKLRALVTDESSPWRRNASAEPASLEPLPFGAGAGLVNRTASTGWVLVAPKQEAEVHIDAMPDDEPTTNPRGWLGGAMVWASRAGITTLHLLLDDASGDDARLTTVFRNPPSIWRVVGRAVEPVEPVAFDEPVVSEDQIHRFAPVITAAGAEVVVDHGVVRAEVLGLEVARVVVDEESGEASLEVGVGRHDRLANAMLGHDRDPGAALANAVGAVRDHRRFGAGPHPANQLARERWLGHIVHAQPSVVDIHEPLVAIEGNVPAVLKRLGPAMLEGANTIVACSVGLDLDAVVDAADVRNRVAPQAMLVLVMPEQDALASQRTLVSLVEHCELRTVPNDWPSLLSGTKPT